VEDAMRKTPTKTRRKPAKGRIAESKEIKKVRREVETLLADPKFKKMSRAFKHSLAQRLGVKDFEEGGLIIEASAPVTIREIMKRANITDLVKPGARWPDDNYFYCNIYCYSFW
jgi:hypothetical protein